MAALLTRKLSSAPDSNSQEAHPIEPRHHIPTGRIITHCTVPGVVALTFDDGPYYHTNHVLDLLDEYGAKATFFINGDNWVNGIDNEATPWPGILRRIDRSGHQIGSHTWSHIDMTNTDSDTRLWQLTRLEDALINVLGKYPTYFRPPYATCEGQCLSDLEYMGYYIINFDIDTKDYAHKGDIEVAMNNFAAPIDEGHRDSFLVLSHDVHQETAYTLAPFMLQKIRDRGLRAVTVGECLGDAPENWYRWA